MDFLKRSAAPILGAAWEEMDEAAASVFRARLAGRRVVDVIGPKGWEFSSVNLGRLVVPPAGEKEVVRYGVRQVRALTELRASFELSQWELDDIGRGCEDADLEPLEDTARAIAEFEDRALFLGFEDGGIQGIIPASDHDPIELGEDAGAYPARISEATFTLRDAGIFGPYALVLGGEPLTRLEEGSDGYPPLKRIERRLDGPVLYSPVVDGGVLLSMRGGDFELTLGQDLSLGYESHDPKHVKLFFTESFTFRILEPAAAVPLSL